MPKLSRRRRQLLEISSSKKNEDHISEDGENETQDDCQQGATEQPQVLKKKVNRASSSSSTSIELTNIESEKLDDKPWVQCDVCTKWRSVPKHIMSDLPDVWTCNMNFWNLELNSCDIPEESWDDTQEDEELLNYCRLMSKKFRLADKCESRFPSSNFTRGKKKKIEEIDWIQCQNPACMKWRMITVRGIDYSNMLHKLNTKGNWKSPGLVSGGAPTFYCAMNYWDDTTASCSVPQESLMDASWNLENIT